MINIDLALQRRLRLADFKSVKVFSRIAGVESYNKSCTDLATACGSGLLYNKNRTTLVIQMEYIFLAMIASGCSKIIIGIIIEPTKYSTRFGVADK